MGNGPIARQFLTRTVFPPTDHTLNTLDPEYSSKWRKYLQLKQHFYMAYVRNHNLTEHASWKPGTFSQIWMSWVFMCLILLFVGILLSRANAAGRRQVWGGYQISPGGRKVYVLDFTSAFLCNSINSTECCRCNTFFWWLFEENE